MKIYNLLVRLEGTHTIPTVMSTSDINRQQAIYYIHRLRKHGYVKTQRLSNNKRVYKISLENKLGGITYYEVINKAGPIKLVDPHTYVIYGKDIHPEDALIFAINTRSVRAILASLALFKKIDDWSRLYQLAKKNHIERFVGALYDLSRKLMKTRRMTKRFRNNALPKEDKFEYIKRGLRSKHFHDIENTWKIYLPFNWADLEDYV